MDSRSTFQTVLETEVHLILVSHGFALHHLVTWDVYESVVFDHGPKVCRISKVLFLRNLRK